VVIVPLLPQALSHDAGIVAAGGRRKVEALRQPELRSGDQPAAQLALPDEPEQHGVGHRFEDAHERG